MIKKLIAAAVVALASTSFAMAQNSNFNYNVDRFADIEVLRYQVPGFNDLWCAKCSRPSTLTTMATAQAPISRDLRST